MVSGDRRRYSSVNGGGVFQTPIGSSSQPVNGTSNLNPTPRYSFAGRPSIGPTRVSKAANIANEFAVMSISQEASKLPVGRLSLAPPSSRHSLEARTSLSRRSSAYGKQSFSGSNAPAPLPMLQTQPVGKDPRPIRDKTFQANCIKLLLNQLAQCGYPHPISQKILQAPSAKDFQQIFKFLYGQLDSTYEFGKKFEEEVPNLMKGLRYPYAGDISKSQLYAVGSMHAWPSLLAMLTWMVELIMCCDEIQIHEENTALGQDGTIESPEKIFFDYLGDAYSVFLGGNDNFDSMIAKLGANFDRRNETTLIEVDRLSNLVAELEAQYQELVKEEPPLAKAQREKAIYASDIDKFTKFIAHLQVKRQKFVEAIDRLGEDIATHEENLAQTELDRSALQAQVEAQDICPEDIDRMNADKDQLLRNLESLNQAKEEASKLFWERELLVQKKLDIVEKLIQEFNFAAERIGLIPSTSSNSGGMELELAFNPHASKMDLLINLDNKTIIQPALTKLREECHVTTHQTQDRLLEIQESLDRLTEALTDKQEELVNTEDRIRRIVQTYLEEKEQFATENKNSNEQADLLEETIQKLRSDTSASLLQSQQRLQRIKIEYDQMVTRIAGEKESIANEIYRILEELINFKTFVETTIGELDSSYTKELTIVKREEEGPRERRGC